MLKTSYFIALLLAFGCIFSCQDDDSNVVDPTPMTFVDDPSTYMFNRAGTSSVSFTGQTERADMLAAMVDYLQTGNNGELMEAAILKEAFRNEGGNGAGFFDFTSSNQLENMLFGPDLDNDVFDDLFEQAAIASKTETSASNGQPGLITRENTGTTILVNNRGHDFSEFIEKGVIGSVFLNQIFNTFLTTEFTGEEVDNITIAEGNNFTDLEHHWDEAFGYFQAPGDFGSAFPANRAGELRFWSEYSNVVDPILGISDRIMDAYRNGREAILANDFEIINESRDILYQELELLAAATTLSFINLSLDNLENGDTGEFFNSLSQAYMFANALRISPRRIISLSEIHNLQNVDFGIGANFWDANADGLNEAKNKILNSYPSLEAVQDEL